MPLIRTLRRVLAGVLGAVTSLLGRVTGLLDRLTRLLRPGGGTEESSSDDRSSVDDNAAEDDAAEDDDAEADDAEADDGDERAAQADDAGEDREDEAAQADGAGDDDGREPAPAVQPHPDGDAATSNGSGGSGRDRRLDSRRRRDMVRRLQRLSDEDLAQLYAVEARTRDREEVLSVLRQAMTRRRIR